MSNFCSVCGKKFSFFDFEYECKAGCGGTYCYECIIVINNLAKTIYQIGMPLTRGMEVPKYIKLNWTLTKGYIACSKCLKKYESDVVEFNRVYAKLIDDCKHIEIFPSTYKGKIKYKIETVKSIETNFFVSREIAEIALKIQAFTNENDIIFENKWEKSTGSEPGTGKGTHYFTVWRGVAKSAKKI